MYVLSTAVSHVIMSPQHPSGPHSASMLPGLALKYIGYNLAMTTCLIRLQFSGIKGNKFLT